MKIEAGVDEAGRGPLAGPVVAAAVILNPANPIRGLADSKTLSEKRREALFEEIKCNALSFAIGRAEVFEIDKINILQATLLAMQRAVNALNLTPEIVLVDGRDQPNWHYPTQTIIQGDMKIACISAASIIAKVSRDREMAIWDKKFPAYGFAKHKGYGTKAHVSALQKFGVCEIHRRSFAPVREILTV